jgi:hypothetical protein
MAEIQPVPTCPACGKEVNPSAGACPACGQEFRGAPAGDADVTDRPRRPRRREDDDPYPDAPRRRPRDVRNDPTEEALSWIVPMRESLWAIAAGYMGLFACFPLVGLLPAILGIVLGIVALKDIKRNRGRRGAFRAWFGIVLGSLMLLVWGPLSVMVLIAWIRDSGKGGFR